MLGKSVRSSSATAAAGGATSRPPALRWRTRGSRDRLRGRRPRTTPAARRTACRPPRRRWCTRPQPGRHAPRSGTRAEPGRRGPGRTRSPPRRTRAWRRPPGPWRSALHPQVDRGGESGSVDPHDPLARRRPSGPSRRTDPNRNPTALATSGSAPTRATTSGENPVNWVVSMTSSASRVESDASTCAFADSPRIATIATSARPMTSALAVAAVRRGLRIAFPRAIAPGTPAAARTGAPNAARASERTSRAAPRCRRGGGSHRARRSAAPRSRRRPTATGRCPRRGSARSRRPAPARPGRAAGRCRAGASGRSVIAAIGGMRRRPDRRPERGADGDEQADRDRVQRRCAAAPRRRHSGCGTRASRPATSGAAPRSTPSTRPASDAIAPTTAASSTTAAMTCRRARAHGPQQPELARALRDEDRERVEDDERHRRRVRALRIRAADR